MLTLSCIIESRRFLKSGSLSNAREKDFLLLFLLFFSFLCFPFHCWDKEKKRRRVTFRLTILNEYQRIVKLIWIVDRLLGLKVFA